MTLRHCLLFVALIVLAGPRVTMAADPIAMVTEIRTGQGEVRVKGAQESDWKPALPLLSLRPDDQVRATNNAVAVLMFTDGQGPPRSLRRIPVPGPQSTGGWRCRWEDRRADGQRQPRAHGQEERPLVCAAHDAEPPPAPHVVVAARRQAAGRAHDRWSGSDRVRYTVRVVGPAGVVWESKDLPRPCCRIRQPPRLSPPASPIAASWRRKMSPCSAETS